MLDAKYKIKFNESDDPDAIIKYLRAQFVEALVEWHDDIIANKLQGEANPDRPPIGIMEN